MSNDPKHLENEAGPDDLRARRQVLDTPEAVKVTVPGPCEILYTHPGKSSYHDNTIWFPLAHSDKGWRGIWLKPGQVVAVLSGTPTTVLPDCPECSGQTEFNGVNGVHCYHCGYDSGAAKKQS